MVCRQCRCVILLYLLIGVFPGHSGADVVSRYWAGTYRYEESYPGPEKTAIVVEHTLEVSQEKGKWKGILHSEGYQDAGTTLLCRVRATREQLTLTFVSYADGKTVNQYGVAVYKPGTPLLTLRRSQQKGKSRMLTYWSAYEPAGGKRQNGRVCFVKITPHAPIPRIKP